MSRSENQEIFIRQYCVALDAGMTLFQFADFLQIQPKSVIRRKNKIKQEFGLQLQSFPTENGELHIIMPDTWKEEYIHTGNKVKWDSQPGARYVIVGAQNATPVDEDFLKAILLYCDEVDARLVVVPYRYKNPTSIFHNKDQDAEWWDKSVVPHLCEDDVTICDGLTLVGTMKVQPTATNPLSGLDSMTGLDSAIIAHPKIQLLTVPTPSKDLPKILSTTGTITRPNYTDSKAGHKGEFHHSLAATIIEVDNGCFHHRHIHASGDGSFYDLDKHYSKNGVKDSKISGLITGDSHAEFMDEYVKLATYMNSDSIMGMLKPAHVVYHDIEDFYRRNHHHRGDPFLSYAKHHLGRDNVEEGLQITADFMDSVFRSDAQPVIVKSNHDEAFDRWLKESDPKLDPENAKFYHYMMYNLFNTVEKTDTGFSWEDPFKYWCHFPDDQPGMKTASRTKFLGRDDTFQIEGIECGFHGDKGPNGGRGSAKGFTKIGPKCVIGHSHSPRIEEGVYQVGLSAMKNLDYVSGPSSWMQTHCIIYEDGKRTLVHVVNGKWRL